MKLYDLYLFRDGTDVIVAWHKLEAAHDAAAIELANKFPRTERMELWEGSQLTKRWESPE